MNRGVTLKINQYYDSVFLMGINNRISKMNGVEQAAVLMGSPANKEVLTDLGFQDPIIASATPNDLIVAVMAESQAVIDEMFGQLDELLTDVNQRKVASEIHNLGEALASQPASNLVVISVPGEYAAHESRESLEAGKHVFLFSDNVSLEDEISLKQFALERGLLLMGPDCGTSILGGVGIGFANAVRRGEIGVIAAAGTGLQEFTSLVHNLGYGISQAIGTGGRDLSDAVGGITTLMALDALERDAKTRVIAIVSKPPGPKTLARLIDRFRTCRKPIIGCFLGIQQEIEGEGVLFQRADVIDEAVHLAIGSLSSTAGHIAQPEEWQFTRPAWTPRQKYLRGVFAGGTFCYQSQQILRAAGLEVYSNGPLDASHGLIHPDQSREHTIVDMGDEFYMVGRPHPMIDGSQRASRILKEAQDPQVAILLLDFILGYNASKDPVGELLEAIIKAQELARQRGGDLRVVASICGTENDPQDAHLQSRLLKENGVVLFQSNARATQYCVQLLGEVANG
jgi:FdrA protein